MASSETFHKGTTHFLENFQFWRPNLYIYTLSNISDLYCIFFFILINNYISKIILILWKHVTTRVTTTEQVVVKNFQNIKKNSIFNYKFHFLPF